MDFSPIYNALIPLWYLIPLFIFVTVIRTAWFKGLIGEFIINVLAKWKLDNDTYHLIKNVTLPTENGTTQIDHIIVSIYGVFVVETKNIRGWIFGGQNQKMWTQQIFKHKSKFQNPLHQNYKHVKTLQSLLNLEDNQLHSVVVFIGNSQFKTAIPENVTYGMGYIRYIQSKIEPVLTQQEKLNVILAIESDRLMASFKTNREHVRHVKEIISVKSSAKIGSQICSQICSKCSSEMVLRETKTGKNKGKSFWGCSQFPKCRGTVIFETPNT